jgi:serine phosphatase RsbU (regulator of sigma subunit)
MSKNIFFSVLFIFVVVYAVASLLVIIFNLPTSSVFEKKIKELSIFQELSHAVYKGENRQQIYQILLDSAYTTVSADAAWIMTNDGEIFLAQGISREKAMETKEHIYHAGFDEQTIRKIGPRTLFSKSTTYEYNSILAVPLINGNQYFGMLALLKHIQGAFDNTMVSMVNTFVAQVSVALQNLELVSQAVENERYKGELEIAKRVQSRLLPKVMLENGRIKLVARAESADEVGGDYYDFFRVSEHESVVVIADVAGKGISAAFNMAQLKGIFHALVRLNLNPGDFLLSANAALSSCLERSAFITASYFLINTQQETVHYARAGHCPALYYCTETQEVKYLESEGLGLGIIRDERYKAYVKVSEFRYKPGDLMMLYTDGITEAFSEEHTEQFGYERLQTFFEQYHQRPLEEIPGLLIQEIYHFVKTETIDDDFTVLLVKF